MDMQNVDSTSISAIGYDEDSETLQIEFKHGSSYQYFDVPAQLYDGLIQASSIGQFLNSQVKGHYRYSRI